MYFRDIATEDISKFHNRHKITISIPIDKIFNEEYFLTEQIMENIYKVYPLFYSDSISSTNTEDKILKNKCIICKYNSDTVFRFKSEIDKNLNFENTLVYFLETSNNNRYLFFVKKNNGKEINDIIIKLGNSSETFEEFEPNEFNSFTDEMKDTFQNHNISTEKTITTENGIVKIDVNKYSVCEIVINNESRMVSIW